MVGLDLHSTQKNLASNDVVKYQVSCVDVLQHRVATVVS
jgi:hypothetical protein